MPILLSDFACVVCGNKITIGRADYCRENGLPGCCEKHEQATIMDMFEFLPNWNEHFKGEWSKSVADAHWRYDPLNLVNDGERYFAQDLPV